MKKSVMFLLLSLVCLSVSAQNGKVKSGVIGGVSMDWYKDEAMSKGKVGFNIPERYRLLCRMVSLTILLMNV